MLYQELIAVCYDSRTEDLNTLRRQSAVLMVKQVVRIVTTVV
jgi:hypothetical protein